MKTILLLTVVAGGCVAAGYVASRPTDAALIADCERRMGVTCEIVDGPDGRLAIADHMEQLTR